jgi:hypothetical protein
MIPLRYSPLARYSVSIVNSFRYPPLDIAGEWLIDAAVGTPRCYRKNIKIYVNISFF